MSRKDSNAEFNALADKIVDVKEVRRRREEEFDAPFQGKHGRLKTLAFMARELPVALVAVAFNKISGKEKKHEASIKEHLYFTQGNSEKAFMDAQYLAGGPSTFKRSKKALLTALTKCEDYRAQVKAGSIVKVS